MHFLTVYCTVYTVVYTVRTVSNQTHICGSMVVTCSKKSTQLRGHVNFVNFIAKSKIFTKLFLPVHPLLYLYLGQSQVKKFGTENIVTLSLPELHTSYSTLIFSSNPGDNYGHTSTSGLGFYSGRESSLRSCKSSLQIYKWKEKETIY